MDNDLKTLFNHAYAAGQLNAMHRLDAELVEFKKAKELSTNLETTIERMRAALIKLRDCDWVITLPDRMDSVRQIAQEGLGEPQ